MTDARVRDATVIAILGTLVYCGVAMLLFGILGFVPEAIGCFAGAWLSAYFLDTRNRRRFGRALPAAAGIVLVTYVAIDLSYALGRLARGTQTTWEPVMLLLWALATTSWWLVPATAAVIVLLNRTTQDQP